MSIGVKRKKHLKNSLTPTFHARIRWESDVCVDLIEPNWNHVYDYLQLEDNYLIYAKNYQKFPPFIWMTFTEVPKSNQE